MNDTDSRVDALLEQRAAKVAKLRSASRRGVGEIDLTRLEAEVDDLEQRARALLLADGGNPARANALRKPDAPDVGAELRGADSGEWAALLPSATEFRTALNEGIPADGGVLVPARVASKWTDRLRTKSAFFRAGPNIVPMDSLTLALPRIASSSGGGVIAEGALIPDHTITLAKGDLKALSYKSLVNASYEVLADSAVDLRELIARTLVADVAEKVDTDAINGAAGATTTLKGLLAQGTAINLATGNTLVKWDHVSDAIAAIEGAGGNATAVLASVEAANALRKEKASTAGTYQAGGPAAAPLASAWSVPIIVSGTIPAGKVAVCDMTRVNVGVREDLRVDVDTSARFANDQTSFRVRYRIAGIDVQDARLVQVITPAAS